MSSTENFKISAALKNIIGKELITNEFVAVFELVKNSFDANATKIEIIFENNYKPESSKIIIKDNGKGMNYNDLKDKWLFVAYSAKRTGKENEDYRDKIKSNRIFAGAKGIGRFSCDRLGKHLNLITLKNEDKAKIENLNVDWEKFENADEEEFINISVTHNTLSENKYQLKYGTVLEISGLRDEWDRDKILKLKKSLAKLINPNQENDSDGFEIEIIAEEEKRLDNEEKEEREKVNGLVKNPIFETLGIKTSNIIVKISEYGEYIETILQDRGDRIYYLKEKNPYQELHNISIHLFVLNKSAKINFKRIMGVNSVDYGSFFMYKNGFRIYPYGEEGEDRLLIDRRKQQGHFRYFGTRELIGRIEINGEQPELREITSRDGGLVKTKTYDKLVEFFYDYALRPLENYVINIIKWGEEKIDRETGEIVNPELWPKDVKVQILELISGFINSNNIIDIQYDKDFLQVISEKQDKSVDKIVKNINRVASQSDNPELVKEAKKIELAVKGIRAEAEQAHIVAKKAEEKAKDISDKLEIETQKNQYLNATRKTLSDDAEQLVHSIDLYIGNASIYLNNLLSSDELSNSIKQQIYLIKNNIDKALKVSQLIIKSQFDYKFTSQRINLPQYIKEYLNDIAVSRPNINIKTSSLPEKMKMVNPIDIDIIIDNLISNSIKAKAKNILVEFNDNKESNKLELYYYDDGNGVSEKLVKNPNEIFELGVRDSDERGSGIGMYDVRKRLEDMKATIVFNGNNVKLKGASFKIEF